LTGFLKIHYPVNPIILSKREYMPTVTVLYGHAYDGKHEETFRKCLEKIRRNEGDSCVYLVRSDVRVRQLHDRVLRELSGCFHFPVVTFPDFIKKLYRKRTGTQRVISTLEQKLLIEEILRQRERECGTEFYFTRFRDHPGILSKIMEFITGVRRIGIASPQELAERLRNFSGRRQHIYEELVCVFERYEEHLRAANAIDDTGIFLDVAQQAVTGQLDIHSYISSFELLVLEGYYELTLPEQQILSFLCSQFERSILTLDTPLNPYHFPDETETPNPFRVFRNMMDYIQESGFSLREFSISYRGTEAQRGEHPPTSLNAVNLRESDSPPLVGGARGGGTKLSGISGKTEASSEIRDSCSPPPNLPHQAGGMLKSTALPTFFKGGLPTPGSSQEGKGETFPEILELRGLSEQRLFVKSYRDKKEEVTEIAREIRTLYREGEITALHDVGVTFPVIEQYERLVREIFPLFGIPFTMFQGYSLASSPVVVTIFRLLQVILDEYSREAMGKLFSSPLVEFRMTEEEIQNKFCTSEQNKFCAPGIALNCDTYHHLDSLARSLGIIGGKEEWEEKLTQYKTQLEQQQAENNLPLRGVGGCPPDCPLPTAYCLLPTTYCLLNFLSCFETERLRPPEEFIELLLEGIQQFQIPQRVVQSRQRIILENDASALQAFFRILNTLQQELSSYRRKSAQPSSFTLQEFSDLLRTVVQGETYYLPETFDDSVFIMGRLDTRQVQFKHLFFGGLVERDFPGQDEPNIFLSEQEAEVLGLPIYKKRVEETDHIFYLNLLNPTGKLYLSYPLQEGETDLLRSAYIEKVLHWQTESCNGVQDISCQEGQDLSQKTLENIFTYTELYQWLGTRVTQKVYATPPLPPSRENTPLHPPQGGITHPSPLPGGEFSLSKEEEDVLRFIKTEKGREFVANFLDGLQAQRFRTSEELSHFDGVLISHWSKNLLHRSYSRHIYSASEFDQYVRCPIKFFFQRVLYLEPLLDISTEIPAFTIGILLHRIVYRFYTGGVQNLFCQGNVDSAFLQRKTDKEQWIREASIRMENIIREELNSFNLSGVFGERLANSLLAGLHQNGEQNSSCSGVQNLFCKKGLLATFIELEANDTNKVMPCYLNAHFGMPVFAEERERQTKVYTPEAGFVLSIHPFQFSEKDTDGKIVSLKIRGEIDRIDLEPESSIERENPEVLPNSQSFKKRRVVIYDYKTGSIPSLQKIKDGLLFQLPLYLLAVQHFLGEDYEVVAGGYYQLKSPNDIGKKGHLGSKEYSQQKYFEGSPKSLFDTHEEFLKLLGEYKKLAVRTAQAIKEGRFHPTLLGPQDARCGYCEYNRICRVDHQQMKNILS
jgi:ATP-dependent helicase/DNAse subunit B